MPTQSREEARASARPAIIIPRAGTARLQSQLSARANSKEVVVVDDFVEHDLDTPTETELNQFYGSKFLSAVDVGNRKIPTNIESVGKVDLRNGDGTKRVRFVLRLGGIDKPMVLNVTNVNALIEKLGRNPASWKGASVGIYVDPNVTYGGKRVAGLRLRVLGPVSAAKPVASPMSPEPPQHDNAGIEDMSDSIPF
jgi:hypothetical protein